MSRSVGQSENLCLVSDDIVLSELPPGAMLSAVPHAEAPKDTYFWSITYSIAANARKLSDPSCQKLETRR